jgi:CubicO group peptidase (beta-lactamase class C family)
MYNACVYYRATANSSINHMTAVPGKTSTSTSSQSLTLDHHLDAVIETALVLNRIVGAFVMVAHRGDIVYQSAAGFAERETRTLMQPDTVFRLASLTKPIVSAAALALVEQGKISLDDPATKWIPEFQPKLPDGSDAVISIRQLLTHTAGLSYSYFESVDGSYHQANISDGLDQPGLSITENLQRLVSVPLLYAPGTSFRYSLATDVLGEVVTRVENASLPRVTAALVTGPLRMQDTSFIIQHPERLAMPYVNALPTPIRMQDHHLVPFPPGSGISFAPGRIFDPDSYPSAGAGMVGTAGDFVVFLEALRTGGAPILHRQTVEAMTANQTGDFVIDPRLPGWGFGFGAAILRDPIAAQTPESVGTYRWGGGYGHSWFVDPQLDLTVVALTNTTTEGMAGVFPLAIRDAVYRVISS